MAFYKYNKTTKELEMIASGKGQLTMDELPTAGSTNTVTSDGIKTAIDNAVVKNQKNVILIQDSYGTNNGSGTTISTTIPLELNAILSKYGINLYSKASNGAGFCNGAFKSNLTTLAGTMTEDIKSAITDIWVLGGWNDEINRYNQTEEQLKTDMETFLTYAKTTFPNADVHLAFISYGYSYQGLSTDEGYLGLYKTLQIYRESTSMGIKYEGRLETVLHNINFLVSDLAHPNADGCKYTAARLADLILTGDTHIHHRTEYVVSQNSGETTEFYCIDNVTPNEHSFTIVEEINDNLYSMEWRGVSDNALLSINKDEKVRIGNNTISIAKYMPRLMRIANRHTVNINMPAVLSWSKEKTPTVENTNGTAMNIQIQFTSRSTDGTKVNTVQIKTTYFCGVGLGDTTYYPNYGVTEGYNTQFVFSSASFTCDAMKLI